MTRFQPPSQFANQKTQQDLFQEFEGSWENPSPLAPASFKPQGNGNGEYPAAPSSDVLEQELEQITAAAIALEEGLNKGDAAQLADLQQSVEQILKSCQGLSERIVLPAAQDDQLAVQWLHQQRDRITAQIRQSQGMEAVFQVVTSTLQQVLSADRVLIYRFDDDHTGCVEAEALVMGWTPALEETLPALTFGLSTRQQYLHQTIVAIADVNQVSLLPHQGQLIERFQIQSSLSHAILVGEQVWGLLVVQQCRQPRNWQPVELDLLLQIAREVAAILQINDAQTKAQRAEQWGESSLKLTHRVTSRIISRILEMTREAISMDRVLEFTCRELRQQLKADRVGVYQFNADWSGLFVYEDKGSQWMPVVGNKDLLAVRDTHLQETEGGRYRNNESFRVDDIYAVGHTDCHIQILEEFQARAYMLAPIFYGQQLWGLLCVYQHRGPRQWEDREEALCVEVAAQVGLAVQASDAVRNLRLKIARESFVSRTIARVRQGIDLPVLTQMICDDLRQLLGCDRVAVYRFNSDWTGKFIAESVTSPWASLMDLQNRNADGIKRVIENISKCKIRSFALKDQGLPEADTYIQQTQGKKLTEESNFYCSTPDIYGEGFSSCYIEVMEMYQVKAYIIGVIYHSSGLPWGMLAAYQCSAPRQWDDSEIDLLVQISNQLSIAVKQFLGSRDLLLALEREKAINKVVDRLRLKTDAIDIAQYICQELRQAVQCDRAAVYRFNPDWTGEYIAESVASGWVSVMDIQSRSPLVMDNINSCSARDLASRNSPMRADTHIQQTQGRTFRDPSSLYRQTANIYAENFSRCYVEALEAYEVKAYVIGIVYDKDDEPWGLLAIYQCSAPREWTTSEIDIVLQFSNQMSVAVQQAKYISQLEETSRQLTETADREKREREELQQQIIQILTSVRPALDGDLTVRAPVTENLVGTVADAYNNTIQSLRQLVAQVKTAATQVDQTSESSQMAIAQMAEQTQRELTEINQALNQIQAMVSGAKSVASSADQVNTAVQQANQIVQNGDQAMNRTVEGITAIRETVAETTQKIKRLSEASQKISRVVNLIQNFTTQTNLLALNAAIEATRAGEYGRGFAVVADEVRLLSQQSAEATAEIERLVAEIQSETSAVSAVMDVGIEQVVKGTSLVTETRQTLNDIMTSTAQISELIHTITRASHTQNQQSETVIQIMNRLANTALQTSDQSAEITRSFQKLLSTSEELQSSVGRFKVD
ncbi:MAG: GAF domain-containing protein [Synechococcales bacterium]|nr:GAF domain-containing protein [Synechococcales bacterium]